MPLGCKRLSHGTSSWWLTMFLMPISAAHGIGFQAFGGGDLRFAASDDTASCHDLMGLSRGADTIFW